MNVSPLQPSAQRLTSLLQALSVSQNIDDDSNSCVDIDDTTSVNSEDDTNDNDIVFASPKYTSKSSYGSTVLSTSSGSFVQVTNTSNNNNNIDDDQQLKSIMTISPSSTMVTMEELNNYYQSPYHTPTKTTYQQQKESTNSNYNTSKSKSTRQYIHDEIMDLDDNSDNEQNEIDNYNTFDNSCNGSGGKDSSSKHRRDILRKQLTTISEHSDTTLDAAAKQHRQHLSFNINNHSNDIQYKQKSLSSPPISAVTVFGGILMPQSPSYALDNDKDTIDDSITNNETNQVLLAQSDMKYVTDSRRQSLLKKKNVMFNDGISLITDINSADGDYSYSADQQQQQQDDEIEISTKKRPPTKKFGNNNNNNAIANLSSMILTTSPSSLISQQHQQQQKQKKDQQSLIHSSNIGTPRKDQHQLVELTNDGTSPSTTKAVCPTWTKKRQQPQGAYANDIIQPVVAIDSSLDKINEIQNHHQQSIFHESSHTSNISIALLNHSSSSSKCSKRLKTTTLLHQQHNGVHGMETYEYGYRIQSRPQRKRGTTGRPNKNRIAYGSVSPYVFPTKTSALSMSMSTPSRNGGSHHRRISASQPYWQTPAPALSSDRKPPTRFNNDSTVLPTANITWTCNNNNTNDDSRRSTRSDITFTEFNEDSTRSNRSTISSSAYVPKQSIINTSQTKVVKLTPILKNKKDVDNFTPQIGKKIDCTSSHSDAGSTLDGKESNENDDSVQFQRKSSSGRQLLSAMRTSVLNRFTSNSSTTCTGKDETMGSGDDCSSVKSNNTNKSTRSRISFRNPFKKNDDCESVKSTNTSKSTRSRISIRNPFARSSSSRSKQDNKTPTTISTTTTVPSRTMVVAILLIEPKQKLFEVVFLPTINVEQSFTIGDAIHLAVSNAVDTTLAKQHYQSLCNNKQQEIAALTLPVHLLIPSSCDDEKVSTSNNNNATSSSVSISLLVAIPFGYTANEMQNIKSLIWKNPKTQHWWSQQTEYIQSIIAS